MKNTLKAIYFAIRRITAKYRKLPGFIIIGVQKGGTSSLYFYLQQHPDIFFPHKKELHFFDLNYDKGINWYKKFFPFFSKKIIGEATPYYIFHPHVPKRIKKDLKNPKFIVVLREPVSRAYSQYKKEKSEGNDKIESFEAAFLSEHDRTKYELQKMLKDEFYYSYAHQRYAYFERGLYFKQITTWLSYFKLEQFLFIKSEDLFENPDKELRRVYSFLNVKEKYPKNLSIKNLGKELKSEVMKQEYYDYFVEDIRDLKKLLGENFAWDKGL